ncbi:RNA polymerase sigma factor [Anaerobacillus isosaccharinicus]|uniref:RNA polymerase subunit sigma-70 n=1 Tax=Anaerobacillus isosaccharinicus TaxID=1532552 RepID=A0A1S2ME53_9BACI|nr:sigma-70 family RNA polymerase sigma factor [Anaerobacillus isosaccharinicus]MBA5586676.1 sigma-70 family RNA polymerase sigma factor [Anaerobacillus isosaccharinicus]QOY35093.1 sigma-70 family RNA polymerase sigma factor [Anaerobacillus isosaccharinicus]
MSDQGHLEEKIEQIYDEYYRDVYHFLICFTGSRNEAEDLTQEVFIQVLKSLSSFNRQYRLKTWVLTIARNVAVDHFRRSKFTSIFKEGFFTGLVSKEQNPDEVLETKEQKEVVHAAISNLKPNYRSVIILRGINELSIRETADILGCSEAKVKVDYFRGLKKLESNLKFDLEEGTEHAK